MLPSFMILFDQIWPKYLCHVIYDIKTRFYICWKRGKIFKIFSFERIFRRSPGVATSGWNVAFQRTDPIARAAEGIDSAAVAVSWTYIDRSCLGLGIARSVETVLWCWQPDVILPRLPSFRAATVPMKVHVVAVVSWNASKSGFTIAAPTDHP